MPLFSFEREHIIPTALWLAKMIMKKKRNVHFLLLLAKEFACYNNGCEFNKAESPDICGGTIPQHFAACGGCKRPTGALEKGHRFGECVEVWNVQMVGDPSPAASWQCLSPGFIKIWDTLWISPTAQRAANASVWSGLPRGESSWRDSLKIGHLMVQKCSPGVHYKFYFNVSVLGWVAHRSSVDVVSSRYHWAVQGSKAKQPLSPARTCLVPTHAQEQLPPAWQIHTAPMAKIFFFLLLHRERTNPWIYLRRGTSSRLIRVPRERWNGEQILVFAVFQHGNS